MEPRSGPMEREDPGWTGGPGVQVPEECASPIRPSIHFRVLGPSSRLGIPSPRGSICYQACPSIICTSRRQPTAPWSASARHVREVAGGRLPIPGAVGVGLREARTQGAEGWRRPLRWSWAGTPVLPVSPAPTGAESNNPGSFSQNALLSLSACPALSHHLPGPLSLCLWLSFSF